jgi:hypothetical protein
MVGASVHGLLGVDAELQQSSAVAAQYRTLDLHSVRVNAPYRTLDQHSVRVNAPYRTLDQHSVRVNAPYRQGWDCPGDVHRSDPSHRS